MFECDSSFSKNVLQLSTASCEIASGIQEALLEFGIISKKKPRFTKGYDHTYWVISISSKEVDRAFSEIMGASIKYGEYFREIKVNTNIDVIPKLRQSLYQIYSTCKKQIDVRANGVYLSKIDGKFKRFTLGFILEPTKELTFEKVSRLLDKFREADSEIKTVFAEYGKLLEKVLELNYFHDYYTTEQGENQ
jgi:hypothetical protein